MKMYKLAKEKKVPIIKNWLGRGGPKTDKNIHEFQEKTYKTARGLFSTFSANLNHAITESFYHYNTVSWSLPKNGWVGCVSKQQTTSTKSMTEGWQSNLLMV